MTYTISLYDALTGINVPKERALAVVEAFEHTMTSQLATKSDVAELKSDGAVLKKDVAELKSDVAILKSDLAELKSDVALIRPELRAEISRSATTTVGIMIGWTSLLFAALHFSLR